MDRVFIIGLIVFFGVLAQHSFVSEGRYANYAEYLNSSIAKSDNPPFVPLNAKEIDTATFWGLLFDDNTEILSYVGSTKKLSNQFHTINCSEKDYSTVRYPGSLPSFWQYNIEEGYKFFQCASVDSYYAVNNKTQHVIFWKLEKE